MINMAYYEAMDRKIQQAGVAELLEIRKSALVDAKCAEELLVENAEKGELPWREDAAFAYHKQMEWGAACCLRLSAIYGELEVEG